jgi:hypothetical protein
MLSDYKAKSFIEAYEKAWSAMLLTWDRTKLAEHLPKAVLKDYCDGQFTLEVPTLIIANVLNRRAEMAIIRKTLELYMPEGIPVSVQIVAKDGQS